jgi:signal transduction histidine kinase
MSIDEIVKGAIKDTIVARNFLETWNIVNEILVSFSKATQLPISIFLEDKLLFHSRIETMPPFCQAMLGHSQLAPLCFENSVQRAGERTQKGRGVKRVQLCHAGQVNAKREIETGIGSLTILFGFKPAFGIDALERRALVIERAIAIDPAFGRTLSSLAVEHAQQSDIEKTSVDSNRAPESIFFDEHDITLIDSISKILKLLLDVTVGFQSLTINMAHELVVMLVGINLMSRETKDVLAEVQHGSYEVNTLVETAKLQGYMDAETKLGLYVVRNYLSQSSEYRYAQVVRPHFESVALKPLITEMAEMYKWRAAEKDIAIVCDVDELPNIRGDAMELRRLLHNVLNNAVKYSYHSIRGHARTIRIYCKVPYDPGFSKKRFALLFENYGLGLEEDELKQVFKQGFRGSQAIREVAVGSGIGLSEVRKIMKVHRGDVKFQSKKLFGQGLESTFLTKVSLIFPF